MSSPRHTAILIGFTTALLLTGAAFALVQTRLTSRTLTLLLIGALAVMQLLVHCRYFLNLELARQSRERIITLTFAVVVALIMALGTLWIMADLKHRMM